MNLNGLDILVLTAVGGSALLGLKRGFVTEVLALFAWVAMVFALKIFHLPVAAALTGTVGTASGAAVLAFVLLAGVTYLLGRLVARGIGTRVRSSVLGPVDRALGLGFGALKGLILASLGFLLVVLVLDTIGGAPTRGPRWNLAARPHPWLTTTRAARAAIARRRRRGQPVFGPRAPTPPVNASAPA